MGAIANIELIRCAPGSVLDEAKARFLTSYRSSPIDTWLLMPNSASCQAVRESIVQEDLPVITSLICTIAEFVSAEFDKYSTGVQADKSCEEIAGQQVLIEGLPEFPLFNRSFNDIGSIVSEPMAYASTLDEFMVDPDLILDVGKEAKAKELRAFVKEYKQLLSNSGLTDQNSLLTITLALIQKGICPKMKHLVIAGFYEAKPIEKALLMSLIGVAEKATLIHPFANSPSVFIDDASWIKAE